MKKIQITINEFVELGGNIKNINPATLHYAGGNPKFIGRTITEINHEKDDLYCITFNNGEINTTVGYFIKIDVEVILDPAYTKK